MPRKKKTESESVVLTETTETTVTTVTTTVETVSRRSGRKRKDTETAKLAAEEAKKHKSDEADGAGENAAAVGTDAAVAVAAAAPAAVPVTPISTVIAAMRAKRKADKEARAAAKKAGLATGDDEAEDDDDDEEEEPTAPPPVTDFTQPKKNPGEIKIVSWNVAGWNSIIGKGFAKYIQDELPDIMCIQETKILPSEKLENYLPGYHGHFIAPKEKKGYSGVAVFSKEKPIAWIDGIGHKEGDDEGRAITAEFPTFYLVNTYIPNAGRKLCSLQKRLEWDVQFLDFVRKLESVKPVIWCGDLNVAHTEIDLANPTTNKRNAGFTVEERQNFTKFLAAGFVDTFRHFYPDEKDAYTFWSFLRNARGKNIGWRLDYFVVSHKLLPKVTAAYRRPYVMGSDHCPIAIHYLK